MQVYRDDFSLMWTRSNFATFEFVKKIDLKNEHLYKTLNSDKGRMM